MQNKTKNLADAIEYIENPRFDLVYQDSLLKVLFEDKNLLADFVYNLDLVPKETKPIIFQNEYNQELFEFLKYSIKKYDKSPSEGHLNNYFLEKHEESHAKIISERYKKIMSLKIEDAEYYKKHIMGYVKKVFLVNNYIEMQSDWSQSGIEKTIPHIRKISQGLDNLDLRENQVEKLSSFLDFVATAKKEDIENSYLPLRIPKLDEEMNGGFPLGTFNLFVGGNNAGKTTTMIDLAGCSALLKGERVIHVPLDGKKAEARAKYIACLSGVELKKLYKPYLLTITEKNKINEVIAKVNDLLVIWTPGEITLKAEALMSKIDTLRKSFPAENIIIDYIGVLGTIERTNSLREVNVITHRLFKNYAVRKNIRVFTAVQANRDGQEKFQTNNLKDKSGNAILRSTNIAESDDIGRMAETILTINITDEELLVGRLRLFLEKQREGKKQFIVGLNTDFSISKINTGSYFDPDISVVAAEIMKGEKDGGAMSIHDRQILIKKTQKQIAEYQTCVKTMQDYNQSILVETDEAVKIDMKSKYENAKIRKSDLEEKVMQFIRVIYSKDELNEEVYVKAKEQLIDMKKNPSKNNLEIQRVSEMVSLLSFYHSENRK